MDLFVVMTLLSGVGEYLTLDGVLTVGPATTRQDIFAELKSRAPARFKDSTVLLFSVEPNALVSRPAGVVPLSGGEGR